MVSLTSAPEHWLAEPLIYLYIVCVIVSLTQLVGTMNNISKVYGSNPNQHNKKNNYFCKLNLISVN